MDRWGYVSYDQPILISGYISSQGSASELRKWYGIAPADLHNLSAALVEKEVETQFQSYFMSWQFHYIGFPVELEKYFIHAYSLPPANIKEDFWLSDRCYSNMWEKRIAEKDPLQWLAAQKAAVDRVMFLVKA
ncbi:interleukin-17 receptor B [Pluvialis apricaria]